MNAGLDNPMIFFLGASGTIGFPCLFGGVGWPRHHPVGAQKSYEQTQEKPQDQKQGFGN
jgi:hypothetical protein